MKIVITGGCGFLGLGIAGKLIDRPDVDSLVLFEAAPPMLCLKASTAGSKWLPATLPTATG